MEKTSSAKDMLFTFSVFMEIFRNEPFLDMGVSGFLIGIFVLSMNNNMK